MKKIIIICSHFFDDTDANAICFRNLVEEMADKFEIHIITDGNQKNKEQPNCKLYPNIDFYFVKESFYERLLKKNKSGLFRYLIFFYSLIRRVVNLFIFPNVSPLRSRKIYSISKKIVKEYGINILLSTYRPFESIYCGIKIRRHFKNIFLVAYHLDNFDSCLFNNAIISKIIKSKINNSFKHEIKAFDKVFVTHTSNLTGDNVFPIGLPVYKKQPSINVNYSFDKKFINVVYVGSLDRSNRNPERIFSLFSNYNVKHEKRILVHLWGKIDGLDDVIKKYREFIVVNKMIENKFVQSLYEKCDFVLNVGNMVAIDMIPSKLFQIFATGVPILSFNNENDFSLRYLNEYHNATIMFYGNSNNDMILEKNISMGMGSIEFKSDVFNSFKPDLITKELFSENKNEI